MQLVAVLVAEQQLAVEPVLDHVRRAPLGGDHGALVEVPPEVVGELLRPAVLLPRALDREVLVVEQEDAARAVAVGVAERRDVDPVGAAVDRVRAAVAGLARDLLGLDHLDDLGLVRVVLDVDDVDARGAQAGHEQVAALDVRVGRPRAQRRGAGVPAEVVQLVADVGHVEPADDLAVGRRAGLEVEDRQRVGRAVAVRARVQRDDVGEGLGRRAGRDGGGGVEAGIRSPAGHKRCLLRDVDAQKPVKPNRVSQHSAERPGASASRPDPAARVGEYADAEPGAGRPGPGDRVHRHPLALGRALEVDAEVDVDEQPALPVEHVADPAGGVGHHQQALKRRRRLAVHERDAQPRPHRGGAGGVEVAGGEAPVQRGVVGDRLGPELWARGQAVGRRQIRGRVRHAEALRAARRAPSAAARPSSASARRRCRRR